MNDAWARYESKWTDLSLKELENFAKWMNEILGHHPTIIGGWAVYFYNPTGLGSRDIDVLFPSWEMRDRIINMYLVNNGYVLKQRAFGEAEWIKLLEPDNPDSETYLDVCTLQDRNPVHGRDTEIPWSIATRWQRPVPIVQGTVYIPEPVPLLILKAKAAWDRNYDIMKSGGDSFLRDKVRKDRFDIISLLSKCKIHQNLITDIISRYEFKECFEEVLGKAITDDEVLQRHDFGEEEIKKVKEKASKILESIKSKTTSS